MGFVSWIAIGLISGWITGMLMPNNGYGVIGDILFGIAGGLGGGFLATIVFGGHGALGGFNMLSVVFALADAVILIGVMRFVPRRGLA